MNELEPLCNFEQSEMLKVLGFSEEVDLHYAYEGQGIGWQLFAFGVYKNHNEESHLISCPTISLAKNWLYEKYGVWMETTYSPEMQEYCARIWTEDINPFCGNNANPMIAESDCLTEVLKRLTNEQIHNPK